MANVAQPPSHTPITEGRSFRATTVWLQWFASLVAAPAATEELTPSASPYEFTASVPGSLLVKAGTVSAIDLTRGRDTITTGIVAGFVPVGRGDVVTVTYTVLPSVWFVPS